MDSAVGVDALCSAAHNGAADDAATMLAAGTDANAPRASDRKTALHLAASKGHIGVATVGDV